MRNSTNEGHNQSHPVNASKLDTIQSLINQLFQYKWVGIVANLFFVLPIVLLIVAMTPIGNVMPDNFSYRADSWWEAALALLLLVIIFVFTLASVIRSATNRQIGWLVAILVFFPLSFFYLLFGRTDRIDPVN